MNQAKIGRQLLAVNATTVNKNVEHRTKRGEPEAKPIEKGVVNVEYGH